MPDVIVPSEEFKDSFVLRENQKTEIIRCSEYLEDIPRFLRTSEDFLREGKESKCIAEICEVVRRYETV